MLKKRLVLNDAKTEVIHIHSTFKNSNGLRVGKTHGKPAFSVPDLGVHLNEGSDMSVHVNSVCQSASFAWHRNGRIRNFLYRISSERLIHAFVTSRLDYCSSLAWQAAEVEVLQKLGTFQSSNFCRTLPHA